MDKKGILSYPNPSPEKVFFLQNHVEDGHTEHILSESTSQNTDVANDNKEKASRKTNSGITFIFSSCQTDDKKHDISADKALFSAEKF